MSARALALAFAVSSSVALAQTTCWERNLGAALGAGDEWLSGPLTLGFNFPFDGNSTASIEVSSNGFVWVNSGASTATRSSPDVASLLADPPSIAALWANLTPASVPGGDVYFNTFAGRAVITWRMRENSALVPRPFEVQLQLMSDGSMVFAYDGNVALQGTFSRGIVGMTGGNGASDPGGSDYTVQVPFSSTGTTLYELFGAGAPVSNGFDLDGWSLSMVPNASGGYDVTRQPACIGASSRQYGRGCPSPSTIYEIFAAGTVDLTGSSFELTPDPLGGYDVNPCSTSCFDSRFANDLGLADDAVSVGNALGFTFAYPGGTSATTAVDVSSNGCVYLQPGTITSHRCCDGDVGRFLREPESIAVYWLDLNPGGSGVYFDTFPGKAIITWNQVPEFCCNNRNTFQCQLFADGRIILTYQTVHNVGRSVLVGVTGGNRSIDPGGIDLTTGVPFRSGRPGSTPLRIGALGAARPSVGGVFTIEITGIPPSTLAGQLIVGPAPVNLDLSPAGAEGCALLVSYLFNLPFPVSSPTTTLPVPISRTPGLLGTSAYIQALLLAPGANPLNVVTTNGLRATVGF